MNKRKIAILCPFNGTVTRGAETFVTEFTKALRTKYDITIFSYGTERSVENETVKIEQPKVFFLDSYKSIYKYFENLDVTKNTDFLSKILKLLGKAVRKFLYVTTYLHPAAIEQYFFTKHVFTHYIQNGGFDLIFPNNGIWGARFANSLRKQKNTPFIYTGHGGIGEDEKKVLLQKPNTYIATNVTSSQWAKQFSPDVTYIPLGADLHRFELNLAVAPQYERLERPIILCVAAFSAFKRQKLLIDAFAKLEKGTLLLIGDAGELKQMIQDYCEKKIPGRFIMTQVPYHETPAYYKLCDVFSLPSIGEAFGLVYLEAMAANKPIVTTDDAARKVIIGPAGILCDVENPNEYAAALEKALSTDWQQIPATYVKENFSWEIIAEKYDQIIKSLIQ